MCLLFLAGGCSADPEVVKAEAVKRGDAFMANYQPGQAVQAYAEAVRAAPRDGEIRLKLARALEGDAQWVEAAQEAIRAADLLPGHREAQLYSVGMMLSQSRFIDAGDRSAAMLKANPGDVQALILSGNATSQVLNSTWAFWRMEEAMRFGTDPEGARQGLRPRTLPSHDKEAEAAFRRAIQLEPTLLEAQLALANFLWTTGRMDEAEPMLKQAADQAPTHNVANRALGLFYERRARPADAEKYLRVAAATGDNDSRLALANYYLRADRPADAVAVFDAWAASGADAPALNAAWRAAEVQAEAGQRDDALRRLAAILARAPRDPRALTLKAELLLGAGETDSALATARASVEAEPLFAEPYFILCRGLASQGDFSGAYEQCTNAHRRSPDLPGVSAHLTRLALVLGREAEALTFARQALRQNSGDPQATLDMARALARVEDWSGAELALKPLLTGRPSAEILAHSAAIHAALGRPAEARSTYLRALQADPGSLDAVSGLLMLDLKQGDLPQARQRLAEARAKHPEHPGYLLLEAHVAAAANDWPRAEGLARQAAQRGDTRSQAIVLLAGIQSRLGRAEEARRLLEDELKQGRPALSTQVTLARLLEDLGRTDEAVAGYERIVLDYPWAAAAGARLARLYADTGRNLDAALNLALTARQLLPDDPGVSDSLGWTYVRKDFATRGRPLIEEAVRAAPQNAAYRYHLGVAYQRTGQLQKAREEFGRAITLEPGSRSAREAQTALEALR